MDCKIILNYVSSQSYVSGDKKVCQLVIFISKFSYNVKHNESSYEMLNGFTVFDLIKCRTF